jgi:hypothetical protein
MIRSIWIVAVLGGMALPVLALADDLKSGPAVGKTLPGAFSPLHCNGPSEGDNVCLV